MFKHSWAVGCPKQEEFNRWIQYELVNALQWNPKLMSSDQLGQVFRFKDHWIVIIKHDRVIFESNKPWFTIRSGLKVFTKTGYIKMSRG